MRDLFWIHREKPILALIETAKKKGYDSNMETTFKLDNNIAGRYFPDWIEEINTILEDDTTEERIVSIEIEVKVHHKDLYVHEIDVTINFEYESGFNRKKTIVERLRVLTGVDMSFHNR